MEGSSLKMAWTHLPEKPDAPLDQFVDAIAGGDTANLVTPAEAAARVVVMAAMYDASAKGKWVELR